MNMQQRFEKFIVERHAIFMRRSAGESPPWTRDKILQTYRFCNVRREDDKVTQWLTQHWRTPHKDDPDLWFAMNVARHINRPETLEQLGYPVPWNAKKFYSVLRDRAESKKKIYNAAYMVVPRQTSMPKDEYLVEWIFTPMWKERKRVAPHDKDTLQSFFERLSGFWGMGTFMSAQVIADIKYVKPLKDALDWLTWAASGPGSKRGLNRVLGRAVHTAWQEHVWLLELQHLQRRIDTTGMPLLHAQDLQNCLCEFDKYERARLGEGTPKQRYKA